MKFNEKLFFFSFSLEKLLIFVWFLSVILIFFNLILIFNDFLFISLGFHCRNVFTINEWTVFHIFFHLLRVISSNENMKPKNELKSQWKTN